MSTIPLDDRPASSGEPSKFAGAQEIGDAALIERFVRDQDQGAFAALVERHGPMVLGVCQRVLQDRHEAEDAFQATFMLLVQRAGSLRQPELLAGWLYGVAYRIAHKARLRAARRDHYDRERTPMAAGDPLDAVASRELRDLLDAELHELPAKYRAALVLCYLEGKTNIEAARELGWPIGSMSARLSRARELLRERLSRRHPALSSSPVSLLLLGFLKPATVSVELAGETVRAMVALTGKTIAAVAESAGSATSAASAAGPARWPLSLVLLMITLLGLAGGLIASDWLSPSTANSESTSDPTKMVIPAPQVPTLESATLPQHHCVHQ